MANLSSYLQECRRLLHDPNGNFWTDTELTDYINDARNRVAIDSKCLRSLQTVNLTQGQELYQISTVIPALGTRAIDVMNITVIWGQMRIPLSYKPWTEFNATMRIWVTNQQRPETWSRYGTSTGSVYVGPVPDQTYSSEWDVFYLPATLIDSSTVEELQYPFTSPVAFFAAYKAKYKEQSYGEAEIFQSQYEKKIREACQQVFTRYLPNVYT